MQSHLRARGDVIALHLAEARANLSALDAAAARPSGIGAASHFESSGVRRPLISRASSSPGPGVTLGASPLRRPTPGPFTQAREAAGGGGLAAALSSIADGLHDELHREIGQIHSRLNAREAALEEACKNAVSFTQESIAELTKRFEARLAEESRRMAAERDASLDSLRESLRKLKADASVSREGLARMESTASTNLLLKEASRELELRARDHMEEMERRAREIRDVDVGWQRSYKEALAQRCESLEQKLARQQGESRGLADRLTKLMPEAEQLQEMYEQVQSNRTHLESWQRRLTAAESSVQRLHMLESKVAAIVDRKHEELSRETQASSQALSTLQSKLCMVEGQLQGSQQQLKAMEQRQEARLGSLQERMKLSVEGSRESLQQRWEVMETRWSQQQDRLEASLEQRVSEWAKGFQRDLQDLATELGRAARHPHNVMGPPPSVDAPLSPAPPLASFAAGASASAAQRAIERVASWQVYPGAEPANAQPEPFGQTGVDKDQHGENISLQAAHSAALHESAATPSQQEQPSVAVPPSPAPSSVQDLYSPAGPPIRLVPEDAPSPLLEPPAPMLKLPATRTAPSIAASPARSLPSAPSPGAVVKQDLATPLLKSSVWSSAGPKTSSGLGRAAQQSPPVTSVVDTLAEVEEEDEEKEDETEGEKLAALAVEPLVSRQLVDVIEQRQPPVDFHTEASPPVAAAATSTSSPPPAEQPEATVSRTGGSFGISMGKACSFLSQATLSEESKTSEESAEAVDDDPATESDASVGELVPSEVEHFGSPAAPDEKLHQMQSRPEPEEQNSVDSDLLEGLPPPDNPLATELKAAAGGPPFGGSTAAGQRELVTQPTADARIPAAAAASAPATGSDLELRLDRLASMVTAEELRDVAWEDVELQQTESSRPAADSWLGAGGTPEKVQAATSSVQEEELERGMEEAHSPEPAAPPRPQGSSQKISLGFDSSEDGSEKGFGDSDDIEDLMAADLAKPAPSGAAAQSQRSAAGSYKLPAAKSKLSAPPSLMQQLPGLGAGGGGGSLGLGRAAVPAAMSAYQRRKAEQEAAKKAARTEESDDDEDF